MAFEPSAYLKDCNHKFSPDSGPQVQLFRKEKIPILIAIFPPIFSSSLRQQNGDKCKNGRRSLFDSQIYREIVEIAILPPFFSLAAFEKLHSSLDRKSNGEKSLSPESILVLNAAPPRTIHLRSRFRAFLHTRK